MKFRLIKVSDLLTCKNSYIVLAIIEIFIILSYVLPFVQHNNLYIWDMVGHYYLADYYKEYLWPRFSGWNPYFFGGFPQGYFYPSLFHWIVGGLGKVIGTFWAFKLITTIVLLAPPFAFYFFLKKAGFDENEATLGTLAMFSALVYVGSFVESFPGGDYAATFNFGLVPQAASISLLFFALGAYLDSFKTEKIILPSILFAALLLTHIYSFVVAIFAIASLLIVEILLKGSTEPVSRTAKIAVLSLALTAFWTIPAIVNREYASFAGFMGMPARPAFLFNILLVALVLMVVFKHDGALRLFTISIPLLLLFVFQDKILQFLPLQMWRFVLYPLLFLSGTIGIIISVTKSKIIKQRIPKITKKCARILTLSIFIILTLLILYYSKHYDKAWPTGTFGMNFTLPKLDGRILTIPIHGEGLNPASHIAPHLVAWSGNEEINGLFIESTPNAGYITHIKREIDERVGIWGTFPAEVRHKELLLPWHFKYIGISYVLTNLDLEYFRNIFKRDLIYQYVNTNSIYGYYRLIKVADNKLIDVLNYTPIKVENWPASQWNWFFDSKKIERLITPDDLSKYEDKIGTGYEQILIQEKTWKKLKFYVEALDIVPIHVKIPYHPNWRAYVNGKEAQIYRVPINMMLVYGAGDIELRYEPTFVDIMGILITLVGVCAIICLGIKNAVKKTKRSK